MPRRYLSCVAVRRQGEIFLFDCGEAAQIQYKRAGLGFAGLSTIFISHLHGDHVLGLMGLLLSLHMARHRESAVDLGQDAEDSVGEASATLTVYGPRGIRRLLHCYLDAIGASRDSVPEVVELESGGYFLERQGYSVRCEFLKHGVPCLGYAIEERPRRGEFDGALADSLGIPRGEVRRDLITGLPITLHDGTIVHPEQVVGPPRPGGKLVYCTDTAPCEAARNLAQHADLLIHEGTFGAELGRQAWVRGHSTVHDAAEVALAAGVQELAITHISPRYADTTPLLEQARAVFPNTRIARDLLQVDVFPRAQFPP